MFLSTTLCLNINTNESPSFPPQTKPVTIPKSNNNKKQPIASVFTIPKDTIKKSVNQKNMYPTKVK